MGIWRKNWLRDIAVLVLILSGCTTSVRSVPLSDFSAIKSNPTSTDPNVKVENASAVPQGIIYRLPLTALDYEAKYRLVRCGNSHTEPSTSGPYEISLLDVKVTTVTVADVDPNYTFVVNPKNMTSVFKQVKEAQLEIHEGHLKKLTYEAEDRTRQIIGQAADVALRFGTITTPGAPGLLARGVEEDVGCNQRAVAAL